MYTKKHRPQIQNHNYIMGWSLRHFEGLSWTNTHTHLNSVVIHNNKQASHQYRSITSSTNHSNPTTADRCEGVGGANSNCTFTEQTVTNPVLQVHPLFNWNNPDKGIVSTFYIILKSYEKSFKGFEFSPTLK